jgi:hypothetical protein
MRIESYEHRDVKSDGTFEHELGAVYADGGINVSSPDGGCGMDGCNCSPGHYISVSLPRTKDGIVRGVTFRFKSREELLHYLGVDEVMSPRLHKIFARAEL